MVATGTKATNRIDWRDDNAKNNLLFGFMYISICFS